MRMRASGYYCNCKTISGSHTSRCGNTHIHTPVEETFFRLPPHREKACCDMCSQKIDHWHQNKNVITVTHAAISIYILEKMQYAVTLSKKRKKKQEKINAKSVSELNERRFSVLRANYVSRKREKRHTGKAFLSPYARKGLHLSVTERSTYI